MFSSSEDGRRQRLLLSEASYDDHAIALMPKQDRYDIALGLIDAASHILCESRRQGLINLKENDPEKYQRALEVFKSEGDEPTPEELKRYKAAYESYHGNINNI
jgi:tRNA A37 N6-isopentenylltransferase MiaA